MNLTAPGVSQLAFLPRVSKVGSDIQVKVLADKIASGGGMFVGIIGRKISGHEYRTKVRIDANGSAHLYLTQIVGGTEATLQSASVPGLVVAAGDHLRLRMIVSGSAPTTLQTKVWRDGLVEPAGWLLTAVTQRRRCRDQVQPASWPFSGARQETRLLWRD